MAVRWWVGLGLGVATAAVFAPVGSYDFLILDDPLYVVDNPTVRSGLTPGGVAWAFSSHTAATWHPLTMISLMAVAELFGPGPSPQHWVNLALHAANVGLLFALFVTATGAVGRSAFVAAVFGLHPLHVESVAWISERKDVLCGAFWLASSLAWCASVRRGSGHLRAVALAAMALGLMAKPTIVTLPFALLLLDVWPLGRLGDRPQLRPRRLWPLVREKWAFFGLSAVGSGVALLTQQPWSFAGLPLSQRAANAVVSYARYLGKALWPSDLAIFYPHPLSWPAWRVGGSLLLLLAITAVAAARFRRAPFLLTGWLFFLGVLVPVIGLVQVGNQAMADRYTYLPLIGLSWAVAWGVWEAVPNGRAERWLLAGAGALAVLALALATSRTLPHWRDTTAVARRALAVTTDNFQAHTDLGLAYYDAGDLDAALRHLDAAIRIEPRFAHAHAFQGAVHLERDEVDAAHAAAIRALRLEPTAWKPREVLAEVYERRGELERAAREYRRALQGNPLSNRTRNRLARALAKQGRLDEAGQLFRESLRRDPGDPEAGQGLAILERLRRAPAPKDRE